MKQYKVDNIVNFVYYGKPRKFSMVYDTFERSQIDESEVY